MRNMADIFDTYLKAKSTKESYRYIWKIFLKYLKISEKEILNLDRKGQEQKIIDYVAFRKNENRSPTTINLRLNIIQFAFSMNDIVLNWKKLKKPFLFGLVINYN